MTVLVPLRGVAAAGALLAVTLLTVPEGVAATLPDPLGQVWVTGDIVTRGTMLCLLAMCLSSWYLLLMRLKDQMVLLRAAEAAADGFWGSPNLYEAVKRLHRQSPFRTVVERGLGAAEHHGDVLVEQIAVADRITAGMQRSVDAVAKRLQSGLELVASLAATAPWVGLFGTLWGIYRALGAADGLELQSLRAVAGPVGEALMLTGFGLAVAVPLLLVHRFVVWRNAQALASLRNFALDVQAILVRGANRNQLERDMLAPIR